MISSTIPSHPSSQRRYLRATTLPILQSSYQSLLLLHAQNLSRIATAKRAHTAARKGRKRGRALSPFIEEEIDLLEQLNLDSVELRVDEGHSYDFGYDLRNSTGEDTFYYGSWPIPPRQSFFLFLSCLETDFSFLPAKVVHALLQTLRSQPSPTSLSTETLQTLTRPLYESTTHALDFEQATIAAFSAGCRRPGIVEKVIIEKRREQPDFILGNTPVGRGEGSRTNDIGRVLPHQQAWR